MTKKLTRIGIVQIDSEILLNWLKFEGGTIRGVKQDFNGVVELLVEHPDMPEVKEKDSIPIVPVTYSFNYIILGRISPIRDKLDKQSEQTTDNLNKPQ